MYHVKPRVLEVNTRKGLPNVLACLKAMELYCAVWVQHTA